MAFTADSFLKKEKKSSGFGATSFLSDAQINSIYERYQREQANTEAEAARSTNNGGFFGGVGYALEKVGLGFLQSIEGIWDYTAGGLAKLFGADDWAEQQFANDWVDYGHADYWYNPEGAMKVVGDVAGGIGTSLPAIAAVAAGAAIAYFSGGSLSPVAAGLISAGVAGFGAAGTATKEAYRQTGELGGKEFGYGALSGITEAGIEFVSAGIGAGTGQVVKGISKSFGKEVAETTAKSVARTSLGKAIFSGFVGEAFEEGVSEMLDPVWKRLTYDPNAKNATVQEVAYAAFVGGLSGAIMGGVDVSVRNGVSAIKGSNINARGKADGVIQLSENISQYESEFHTDYESFKMVQSTLNELKTSLAKTGGKIQTPKQKMLLGILQSANTSAIYTPIVASSAENLVINAEAVAQRFSQYGYTDANGKPITITADQIREGVDLNDPKSFAKALKTNDVLRTLAVADVAGKLSMESAQFKRAALMGEQLFARSDLNNFIEKGTEAEKRELGERLGIADWNTVTADEFKSRLIEYSENGGLQQYINDRKKVKELGELEISKKGLPKYVGSLTQDGAVRYKFGDASVAIIKNGDKYQIYDYAGDMMSKPLSKVEANRVLKEIYAASTVSETAADVKAVTQQLDTFASENIPDYKTIGVTAKQDVRATLRQARAAGLSEADQILYGKLAARSGVAVEFVGDESALTYTKKDGTKGVADAAFDRKNNTILVNRANASNPKARTTARIILHEFTHTLIADGTVVKNGKHSKKVSSAFGEFYNLAINGLTAEQQAAIITPYIETHGITVEQFLKVEESGVVSEQALKEANLSIKQYAEIKEELCEELAAHFVEQELGSASALERIMSDKPSFKDKLLSFLKRKNTEHRSDEKLSRVTKALLKKYQQFFNEYSAHYKYNNTVAGELGAAIQSSKTSTDGDVRLALSHIDNYNEKSYNKYGWAVVNDVLSMREYSDFNSKLNNLTAEQKRSRTTNGEYIIAVNDMKGSSFGVDNVLVFAKGTYQNPEITRVMRIGLNNETDIDIIRSDIYARETSSEQAGAFYQDLYGEEIIREYTLADVGSYQERAAEWRRQRSGGESRGADSSNQQQRNRGANKSSAQSSKLTPRRALPETEQAAVKEFGSTYRWNETGYILTDGTRLDFSGRKEGASGGYRTLDHRDIKRISAYSNTDSSDAMIDFMQRGNIRIMPESNGVNIAKPLTTTQERVLGDYISKVRGEIVLDIDDAKGYTVVSVEYPKYTHYSKILQDIRNYFKDGTQPTVSELGKFRYALPETDSRGVKLSSEQQKYFADSKAVDKNGKLLVVYHGSPFSFTEFESKKSSVVPIYGEGHYFTNKRSVAKSYSGTNGEIYKTYLNIKNPYYATYSDEYSLNTEKLRQQGYDGVIADLGGDLTYLVVYDSNQIKLASNKTPTSNRDIRYAISDDGAKAVMTTERIDSLIEDSGAGTRKDYAREWITSINPTDFINLTTEKRTQDRAVFDSSARGDYGDGTMASYDYIKALQENKRQTPYLSINLETGEVVGHNGRHRMRALEQRGIKSAEIFVEFYDADGRLEKYKNGMFNPLEVVESMKIYNQRGTGQSAVLNNIIPLNQAFREQVLSSYGENTSKNGRDIRFALPDTDSKGRELTDGQRKFFKDSKVVDSQGKLLEVYHGSPNSFYVFDSGRFGQGTEQYGSGFYFASVKETAENYGKNIYESYLNIKKPFVVVDGKGNGAAINQWYNHKITEKQAYEILKRHPLIYSMEESPLGDYFESYWEDGASDELIHALARQTREVGALYDNTIFGHYPTELLSAIRDVLGYDGIQVNFENSDAKFYVAWFENQIKLTTSEKPTNGTDIRYAMPDTNPDPDPNSDPNLSNNSGAIGGLTRGQRAKFVANNTRFKVYSKMDAASVIDSIIAERLNFEQDGKMGSLSGKSRAEVIEQLFTKLNNTKEGYRAGVALDIADYIINNAVLSDMFDTYNDDSYAMSVLSVLRGYMHGIDLSGIQGEIRYKFDKKNAVNLVWGAKKGEGIAPDVLAMQLEDYGIRIDAINPAEQFFEILDLYESAKSQVNQKAEKVMLTAYGSKTELDTLRQEIARDVLAAYDKKGSQSKYSKLVEKYTDKIAALKKDLSTAYKRNSIVNRIIDSAGYLRDVAAKRNYVGAEVFTAPELTSWLKQLGKLKYRADLRKTGVRKILLDYGLFYNTNNTLLYDPNPDLNYIDQNVVDALNLIRQNALSNKPLTMEELQAAEVILASAKHLFNTYDQIIIEGKKAQVSQLATEGNEIIKKSKNRTDRSFFSKVYGVFNKIVEPRVVIKSLENYNPNGILTRAYAEITRGETEAGLLYIELTNDIDTYLKKNKRYSKRLSSEYIKVGNAELTVGQAISLYELSKRTQAQEGLYESGFSYIDKKGSKQTAHITEADIKTLQGAFTEVDNGFIELVEAFFNIGSKQVKTDADLQILGYTNTSDEFYFPIKRDSGTIAKNITDARSIMADWANVYNFSFNKDVKTGAKNKLFITDVYSVVTRHAKQLSTYAKMTVPLKNFSQIYSKNIGDKTNVVSIRNTINEQVWGGAEGYLSKLFADIQGTVTSSSFIEKLRGAYAKYQLGANLKVIVSQITSYPTAGIMLDTGVMAKGFVMKTNWEAMDKYCPYARVRNYERGIVRAEGVIDKVGKVGDVLTKPIQWTDRLTIGRLWNACQLQVQKDTGLKLGTTENMQKAGVMLEDVVRLTQPNYTNTERSALMRSDSDIVRSFTMFTSVPLKQLSRLVESVGEYNALRSMVKSGNADADTQARFTLAKKKLRRTLASVAIANLMYVMVAQFFKWLYNNQKEDKDGKVTAGSVITDMISDFAGTTVGMFPVVRDIYGYFVNGYEINSFTGDTLNGILSGAKQLFSLASKAVNGEDVSTQDMMSTFRTSLYGIGQITGIPFRNINNTISGLIKRFSTSADYKYKTLFYNANYSKDIKSALNKGDYALADTIMSMMLKDRNAGSLNSTATKKLIDLYDKGYTVLPKSFGGTLKYNDEEIKLSKQQVNDFNAIYGQAGSYIEKMVESYTFKSMSEEAQAKAIKMVYDAFYDKAYASVLKTDNQNKVILLSGAISPDVLAPYFAVMAGISSDKDASGNTINGSKKAKVLKFIMAQRLSMAQKLLLIYSSGYTLKDGEIKGVSAKKAKSTVARYITNLKISKAEKIALAEMCGLTVKNGRIYTT